jgi:hypothetical protein
MCICDFRKASCCSSHASHSCSFPNVSLSINYPILNFPMYNLINSQHDPSFIGLSGRNCFLPSQSSSRILYPHSPSQYRIAKLLWCQISFRWISRLLNPLCMSLPVSKDSCQPRDRNTLIDAEEKHSLLISWQVRASQANHQIYQVRMSEGPLSATFHHRLRLP